MQLTRKHRKALYTPAPALAPLEVALGLPMGLEESSDPLRLPREPRSDPVKAIEELLASALARPPCVVSFSGGRDSSGLLALATKVSRERGLVAPVPATLLFAGDAAAAEEEWQTLVLRELGLTEWARIDVPPGWLDAVGPVATLVMQRHGLLWPPNAHLHYPIIERAAGGALVTGFGGDELALASASAHAERLVARQERAGALRTLASVGLAFSPRWARLAVYRRRFDEKLPWLTPRGTGLARAAFAQANAAYPFGFDRKLQWTWRSRYFRVAEGSFAAMASAHDVRALNPFASEGVMAALARRGGMPGLGGRDDLVRLLFAGVLPPAVLRRTSKASFTEQVWSATASTFARDWSGGGTNEDLIDPGRLRQHWLGAERSVLSTTLLQAAWLHDHGGSSTKA